MSSRLHVLAPDVETVALWARSKGLRPGAYVHVDSLGAVFRGRPELPAIALPGWADYLSQDEARALRATLGRLRPRWVQLDSDATLAPWRPS